MPKVEARLIDLLIDALEAQPNAQAIAPAEGGRRGNPVLIGRKLFGRARRLEGDEGARRLLLPLRKVTLSRSPRRRVRTCPSTSIRRAIWRPRHGVERKVGAAGELLQVNGGVCRMRNSR